MSEGEDDEHGQRWYPPHWADEATERGPSMVMRASTLAGSLELALYRTFPDATRFEYRLATTPTPDRFLPPLHDELPMWIAAVRKARKERTSDTDDQWQARVAEVWPRLTATQRAESTTLLAKLAMYWPPEKRRRSRSRLGVDMQGVYCTMARLLREWPRSRITKALVAEKLDISEATLTRLLRDNGLARWPPVLPDDLDCAD